MARELQEAPRSHRLIQLGAVALVTSAAAIAFGRVFEGRATTWKLVGVGLISIGLAAAFERRSPLLAALVSAIGLLWILGLLVFPHTLWHGLPLGKTVHAIAHSLGRVGHQADVQVAPTPPLRPLFMAAVTAVWTAAFSTHALAIRSGSPLLAAAPAAALMAFASVVLEDGPRPGYAILFLAGVLALLFADGLRRVRQWGPVRPWTSGLADVRRRVVSASTTRGARRVALTVVGFAILLPGILPGLASKPVLDLGAHDSGLINPLVSVSASLKQREPKTLFSVHVAQQEGVYWRWLALDRFDGDHWFSGDLDVEHGRTYSSNASLPYTVPDLPEETPATFVSATVTIINKPGIWLPVPYEPFDVSTPGSTLRFDSSRTSIVPDEDLTPGFTYRVDARIVKPDYEQLDQTFDYSGAQYQRDMQLPPDLPEEIPAKAREIVQKAGAHTTLEKALAIQRYLTDLTRFHYDATIKPGDSNDALTDFLFETHTGFCQQFASTMAVLLRSLDIPARVAVGFTPGTYDANLGSYEVTTENAHAWVEVEFPGFGWVPFEPTPARANPVTDHIVSSKPQANQPENPDCTEQQYAIDGCAGQAPDEPGGGATGPGGHKDPVDTEPPLGPAGGQSPDEGTNGPLPVQRRNTPSEPLSWRVWVGIALLAVVGLLLIAFPLAKVLTRRWRVARSKDARERTLAEFRLFESRAGDVGLARGQGETPLEYRDRLSREVLLSDGHLDRLTSVATSAAYSSRPVTEETAKDAARDGRVAIRDVRRSVGVARRFTGLWRPQI
jgi:transglutaminase-like putative cysteine protease